MAMDMDWIYLNPAQQAEHLQNNKCFICHKVRCSTWNHPGTKGRAPIKSYQPRNQQPHNVRNTNTPPLPTPDPTCTQPIDEVASYLNVMCTNKNLSNQDVLHSLQIIFDDSLDEQGEQINMIHLAEIPISTKEPGF